MDKAVRIRDLPWAAWRLARRAALDAVPLGARREAAVLRARVEAGLLRLPEHVRTNLETTLAGNRDLPDVDIVARRYLLFSRLLGPVERMPARRGFEDPSRWPLVGREHLDAALDRGRGAILCTAHLGWWLLLVPILRVHGYDVIRTGGPFFARERERRERRRNSDSRFRRYVRQRIVLRPTWLGADDIPVGLDVRPIFRALAANRPVQIAGDGRHALEFIDYPLLGRRYPLPTGFVKIALESGAPALPLFALEGSRPGSVRVEIRRPLPFDPSASMADNLGLYANVLDEQLRRTPHLWRRWSIPDLYAERRAHAVKRYWAMGRTEAGAEPAGGERNEAGKEDGSRSK